jgi:hypothetical protein
MYCTDDRSRPRPGAPNGKAAITKRYWRRQKYWNTIIAGSHDFVSRLLDDILNQARSPAYGIFAFWGFSTATPQQALLCSGFRFPVCYYTDFSDGIARRDNFFSYNSKMAAMPRLNDGDYRPDLLFVASSGDWPSVGLR